MGGFVDPSKKDDDGYVSVPSLWAIDDFQELRDMPLYMQSSDCIREFFLLSFAGVFWNSTTFVMRRLGVRVSCFGADPLSGAGVCRSFKKR